MVTAYAALRPDGQWSVMLINKDYDHPHQVRILFQDDTRASGSFVGQVAMFDIRESSVSVALREEGQPR